MKYVKLFENDEDNVNNEKLKMMLLERDELIYKLLKQTHGYMYFMSNKNIDIKYLSKALKVEKIENLPNVVANRIILFGDDWRNI